MKRIKNLGVAAVAALALTAFVGTTSASASFSVTSKGFVGSSVVVGSSNFGGINIPALGAPTNCKYVDFSNPEFVNPTKNLALLANFHECQTNGFETTVDMNSCLLAYKLTTSSAPFLADTGIGCTDDKSPGVEVTVLFNKTSVCTLTLPPQWWQTEGALFENSEANVHLTQVSEGIEYTGTGPFCEGESGDDGVISIFNGILYS